MGNLCRCGCRRPKSTLRLLIRKDCTAGTAAESQMDTPLPAAGLLIYKKKRRTFYLHNPKTERPAFHFFSVYLSIFQK